MLSGKRIRVLHVGKFYSPVEGGIENVVRELAHSFRNDSQLLADVLVSQQNGPESEEQVDGVNVRRVRGYGVLLGLSLAPRMSAEIAKLSANYDVLHVHVPNPLPFFCDWEKLRSRGTRLIVHYHSDIVRTSQRRVLRLIGSKERRFYQTADRVLVTSHGLLTHSDTLQPYREKCRILPLSIDLDAIPRCHSACRASVRAELGLRDDDVVFFFLGRLVYYKGVHDLLRAAAISGAKVLIGGAGPLREELWRLTVQLGIAKQVQFLGKIDEARLPSVFASSDVFVLPSNAASEAFGVVQLEAMAHGLPVINTALPTGVPEVSVDGLTGITVPPGDVPALANAMKLLVANKALRLQYASAASDRVRHFGRPAVVQRLREIYREVLALPIEGRRSALNVASRSSLSVCSTPLGSEGESRPCLTMSPAIIQTHSLL